MAKKKTAIAKVASSNGVALDLKQYKANQDALKQFVKQYLTEAPNGKGDFGLILKKDGTPISDQKVLFKRGAEKLAELYQLGTKMTCAKEEENFGKEKVGDLFFSYTYRCDVFSLSNPDVIIAQCEASANSSERTFQNRDGRLQPANAIRKRAQKRAYVGAVIMATRSSQWFTQDMEDVAPDGGENTQQSAKPEGRKSKERRFHIIAGEVGEMKPVTEAYLLKTYGNKSATKLKESEIDSELARLANIRDIVGIFKGQGFMLEKIRADLQKKYGFESWFEVPGDKVGVMLKKARASVNAGGQ